MGGKILSGKYIKFFTYLTVIVLINAVGITLFARIDLTENKIYSISKASQKVVSTLSEPLTINVFFTKNIPHHTIIRRGIFTIFLKNILYMPINISTITFMTSARRRATSQRKPGRTRN